MATRQWTELADLTAASEAEHGHWAHFAAWEEIMAEREFAWFDQMDTLERGELYAEMCAFAEVAA